MKYLTMQSCNCYVFIKQNLYGMLSNTQKNLQCRDTLGAVRSAEPERWCKMECDSEAEQLQELKPLQEENLGFCGLPHFLTYPFPGQSLPLALLEERHSSWCPFLWLQLTIFVRVCYTNFLPFYLGFLSLYIFLQSISIPSLFPQCSLTVMLKTSTRFTSVLLTTLGSK